MNGQDIKAICQFASARFAFIAACLWLRSALFKTPDKSRSDMVVSVQDLGEAAKGQSR
jgi:hypothetical protein